MFNKELAKRYLAQRRLTSLPKKLDFAFRNGFETVEQVHEDMIRTAYEFEAMILQMCEEED